MHRTALLLMGLAGLCLAVPAPARAGCAGRHTPLHALGTSGNGATVVVRGVVTAVFAGLDGFFLEAPRAAWDGDPDSPEGIFVYAGRHGIPVRTGMRVRFAARYQRFHGYPELARPHGLVHCGRMPLPPAVTLAPPFSARAWRAVRGMRVRVPAPLAVDGLHDLTRYGEVRLHAGGRHFAPTELTAPGAAALRLARLARARELWLDDGSSHAHPRPLRLGGLRLDAGDRLRAGDRLGPVTGLAYHAYGRDLLEVTRLARDGAATRPPSPPVGLPEGLRVASFNVQNYFNHAMNGQPFPTERGARTAAQFRCQTQKLVAALAAMHPAIAGLQEVENDGHGDDGALAALVGALNRTVAGRPYRYVAPPGPRLGTDLIAPALVYDARRVEPAGRVAVLEAPPARADLRAGLPRPVLAAAFRPRGGGPAFTVAVVHLRSKYSACGHGLDSHGGAGHCAAARARASRFVAHWLAGGPTGIDAPATILLGDFNAYPHEAAIRDLRAAGWHSALAARSEAPDWTETGRWGSGQLDYVFLSPALAKRLRGAFAWHIDADEAPAYGYAGPLAACTGAGAPYRASDHDPVIAVLGMP